MNNMQIVAGLLLSAGPALAQTVVSSPAFEVASVRLASATPAGQVQAGMRIDPGRVEYANVTLKYVLARAYGVRASHISGPSWLDTERYFILAKVPNGVLLDQVPQMLQTLLLERFKLRARKETRGGTEVYALIVGKGGPKIDKAEETPTANRPDGTVTVYGIPGKGKSGFRAAGVTMATFAEVLERFVDRPVVDMTQLQARYNFRLEFATGLLFGERPSADRGIAGSEGPVPADDPVASLFTGLEQLGLKLEARRASVEYLVVDHAERIPIEN